MIYYGLRSSRHYLELLDEVSAHTEPHDIISVIGGLAFLQALGPQCRSLIALDTDSDALIHARLIIALIRASMSIADFLSFLSSHQILSLEVDRANFGKRVDRIAELSNKIAAHDLIELYKNTYARIELDTTTASGKIDGSTLHFFGHQLAPMNFNWGFGSGAFSSDERFMSVRQIIGAIPFELRIESLDQFNYGAADVQRQRRLFVLASNCDGPLFTSNDSILKRVQQTTLCRTRYISWNRKLDIFPSDQSYADLLDKLTPLCSGRAIYSVGKCGVDQPKIALQCSSFMDYQNIQVVREEKPYNFDSLLIWFDAANQPDFLRECLQCAVPCFRRLVIISALKPHQLIADCQQLSDSYFVETVEWFIYGSIVVWSLRGASFGTGKK